MWPNPYKDIDPRDYQRGRGNIDPNLSSSARPPPQQSEAAQAHDPARLLPPPGPPRSQNTVSGNAQPSLSHQLGSSGVYHPNRILPPPQHTARVNQPRSGGSNGGQGLSNIYNPSAERGIRPASSAYPLPPDILNNATPSRHPSNNPGIFGRSASDAPRLRMDGRGWIGHNVAPGGTYTGSAGSHNAPPDGGGYRPPVQPQFGVAARSSRADSWTLPSPKQGLVSRWEPQASGASEATTSTGSGGAKRGGRGRGKPKAAAKVVKRGGRGKSGATRLDALAHAAELKQMAQVDQAPGRSMTSENQHSISTTNQFTASPSPAPSPGQSTSSRSTGATSRTSSDEYHAALWTALIAPSSSDENQVSNEDPTHSDSETSDEDAETINRQVAAWQQNTAAFPPVPESGYAGMPSDPTTTTQTGPWDDEERSSEQRAAESVADGSSSANAGFEGLIDFETWEHS